MKKVIGIGICWLMTAGCGRVDGGDEASIESEVVHRTIVHLNGDKAPTIKNVEITRAQQQQDVAARLHGTLNTEPGIGATSQAITWDSSCANSSIWLLSGTGCNTSTYEICFYGAGTADLRNYIQYVRTYPLPAVNWAYHVGSYYPGDRAGNFHDSLYFCGTETFNAWQACTDTQTSCRMEQLVLN